MDRDKRSEIMSRIRGRDTEPEMISTAKGERVNAGNLYQIFSYVTNWKAWAAGDESRPEGWLLYAAVDGDFEYRFELMGRQARVCSVDFGQEWRGIEEGLKELIRPHPDNRRSDSSVA